MWAKLAKCLIIPRQTLFAIAKWNTRMFWPPLALKFMSTLFRLPVILKKKRKHYIDAYFIVRLQHLNLFSPQFTVVLPWRYDFLFVHSRVEFSPPGV